MQIDHINPFDKKININKSWNCSKKIIETELKKCQLLCESCHHKKNKVDGSQFKNRICGTHINTAKLNDQKVIKIRKSPLNIKQLAYKYNVCVATIRNIKKYKTWKHV